MPKRAMLFVDAQNLESGAADYYGQFDSLDYVELVERLAEEYDLIRPYYFGSYIEGNYKQDFYHFLRTELGFRVVAVELREHDDRREQKGVDIALATELIAQGFNDSYDVAVVVSGDSDFSRAIQYAQDQGKVVVGASFENTVSGEFKATFDQFVALDEFADELRR